MKNLQKKIKDNEGASIILALVFFLICSLAGATLVTAATINAQATVTYKESRQNNYAVASAASLLADQLQDGVSLSWDWSKDPPQASVVAPSQNTFAQRFWDEYVGDKAWSRDARGVWRAQPISIENIEVQGPSDIDPVFVTVEISRDFNIRAYLSLSVTSDNSSPYNEVLEMQSIPTYNGKGQLTSVTWNSPVITKQGAAIPTGAAS